MDDEPTIVELVAFNLQKEGYEVDIARNGQEALTRFRAGQPDLIILDIMLPVLDGFEVCRLIRRESAVPILMLTARREEGDRVSGLDLGADDYLVKPFSPRELLARVRAILRRTEPARQRNILSAGDLVLDPGRHRVTVAGREVDLTQTEFALLKILLAHRGHVCRRDYLLERVWGYDYFGDSRTVDVHIRHLREKIEPVPDSPRYIETVRGLGYRFREQDES